MNSPTRNRLHALFHDPSARGEVFLSAAELADAVGISSRKLAQLVRLGVVEPSRTGEFSADIVVRLARMLRLHADLGVHLIDAAIIADLVERLDRLEAELSRLRPRSG